MSTPNKTAPDFGEPWTTNLDSIYDRDGPLGIFAPGYGKRIIACVNACAGMSDPAAEIQALRDAVKEAYAGLLVADDDCNYSDEAPANHPVRKALAKLKTLA